MNATPSHADLDRLLKILNEQYPIALDQIALHRDRIGYVYFARSAAQRVVFKLYRAFDTENALRAVGVIQYLKEQAYPVVSIVPTRNGETHITVDTPQGPAVGVLFDFIEGPEPALDTEIEQVGRQVGRLHRLMRAYPQGLIRRGKDFYIDRYLAILREMQYDARRIADLDCYGAALWGRMERLPGGFCHGDLHSGNMRQTGAGEVVLFDFDVASNTSSVIDVAILSNASDFNRFEDGAYDQTLRVFARFYAGYRQECALTDVEIAAMFDFIAIRHYEIIATITACQGIAALSYPFLDQQYDWLMRWQELCARKAARLV